MACNDCGSNLSDKQLLQAKLNKVAAAEERAKDWAARTGFSGRAVVIFETINGGFGFHHPDEEPRGVEYSRLYIN